jgi:hypothetical protein
MMSWRERIAHKAVIRPRIVTTIQYRIGWYLREYDGNPGIRLLKIANVSSKIKTKVIAHAAPGEMFVLFIISPLVFASGVDIYISAVRGKR